MSHTSFRWTIVLALLITAWAAIAQDRSVRPGINKTFENPDVERFEKQWEGESREIFARRQEILDACKLRPGMSVADIGAGTGLFTRLFAKAAGDEGKVYAVDISDKFLKHIEETCKQQGIRNVQTLLCTADSSKLPPDSIDLAFICDAYHHFEFPFKTMASIHAAIRPGGRLVVVDFRRIEGQSSDWVLHHVRAGQEQVVKEITSCGFKVIEEPKILKENYCIIFERTEVADPRPEKSSPPPALSIREEHFDREPPNWEGINNRGEHFEMKTVVQDFGFSPATNHAGGNRGEVGGRINPAGEKAYYAFRFPRPLNLDESIKASGRIFVARGANHFLLGFFDADTAKEWRTQNSLVARINGRGEGFHCHVEYCSSRWRCEAGVIGAIVRGQRIDAIEIPCDRAYEWQLIYDPKGGDGSGLLSFTIDGKTATCTILKEHRADGATFTHFGLLPVLKSWDGPGEVWIDDVAVNGRQFDFAEDPAWDGFGNRRIYQTKNTRPHFDFGWSPTHLAGGGAAGELGGVVFRGDCREKLRLAAYGDKVGTLSMNRPLYASGKVVVTRAVSDSTASIGFYHSDFSLRTSPRQDQSIPMDYLGINIEGPSSEGFFFYPVYRVHGDAAGALGSNSGNAPRIFPDGKVHDWTLSYDPDASGGNGRITVTLDDQSCTLDLESGAKKAGAAFNRFGICTPWIDGNSVTVYFDDLKYTFAQLGQ